MPKAEVSSGCRYVQERRAQILVQGAYRPLQPCTPAQTDPNPGLTLTLTSGRTLTLWGARGRLGQSVTRLSPRVLVAFFRKKRRAAERPGLTNKTRTLHNVVCTTLLHIGRVVSLDLYLVHYTGGFYILRKSTITGAHS